MLRGCALEDFGSPGFAAYLSREKERRLRTRLVALGMAGAAVPPLSAALVWTLGTLADLRRDAIVWLAALAALSYLIGFGLWARAILSDQFPSSLPDSYDRTQAVHLTRFFRKWGSSSSIQVRDAINTLATGVLAATFWILFESANGIWQWFLLLGAVNFSLVLVKHILVARIRPSKLSKMVGQYSAGFFIVREELSANDVGRDPELKELLSVQDAENLGEAVNRARDRIFTATRVVEQAKRYVWPVVLVLYTFLIFYGIDAGYLTGHSTMSILQALTAVITVALALTALDVVVRVSADRSIPLISQLDALLAIGDLSAESAKKAFHAVEILRLNGHTYYGHVRDLMRALELGD